MKKFVIHIIILLLFITGCDFNMSYKHHIKLAEEKIAESPVQSKEELNQVSEETYLRMPLKWRAHYIYLQCQIADKLEAEFPIKDKILKAKTWYLQKHRINEAVSLSIFLGRAYMAERNYSKAMDTLLEGLNIAQAADLPNESGYIHSYIADIYTNNNDTRIALDKYKEAAECFSKANNLLSYGFAKRDIGRTYYILDLHEDALNSMKEADSIALITNNNLLKYTILNNYGNIYSSMNDYDTAIKYLFKAIDENPTSLYNKMALSSLYIESDRLHSARLLLDSLIREDIPENFKRNIYYDYYLIYAKEGNHKEALLNLENFLELFEKHLNEEEEYNFIEAEKKYDHLNMTMKIGEFIIKEQRNIILIATLSLFAFILLSLYLYKGRQTSRRFTHQEQLINEHQRKNIILAKRISQLSRELKSKKTEIEFSNSSEIEEKEKEINLLKTSLQQSRDTLIQLTPLYKKMLSKVKSFKASDKTFVNDAVWTQIELDIDVIYPGFRELLKINFADLSISDIQYCSFSIYGFTTNEEAILLCINPKSISKRRTRIREKLHTTFVDINLPNYLKKLYSEHV